MYLYSNAKMMTREETAEMVVAYRRLIKGEWGRSRELDERNSHKDIYSDPFAREAGRLQLTLEFIKLGFEVDEEVSEQGLVIGDFLIAWQKKKWRKIGKGQWYDYHRVGDFLMPMNITRYDKNLKPIL
jgi:hypothetical protein